MTTKRRFQIAGLICLMAGFFLLTLGTSPALADITSFDLGVPNSGLSGFPPPYATVDVTRTDATHATITFTGLSN